MFVLTLIYEDGSTWLAGGFPTLEDANQWVQQEQQRPYWKSTTQVQIVDTRNLNSDIR